MPGKGKAKASSTNELGVWQCDCVKKLPDADKALEMLHEVKRHADALLKARGWRVKRLYEICCCTSGGRNTGVGGFCVPSGDGQTSLRIALRLRAPKSHELYPFAWRTSSTATTRRSSTSRWTSSKQYETLLAKGQVLDEKNMPIVGGRKADTSQHNAASRAKRGCRASPPPSAAQQAASSAAAGGSAAASASAAAGRAARAAARPARWRRGGGGSPAEVGRRPRPRGGGAAVREHRPRHGRGRVPAPAAARADRCGWRLAGSVSVADPPAATRRAGAGDPPQDADEGAAARRRAARRRAARRRRRAGR